MRAALAVRGLARAGELWTAIVPVSGPIPSTAELAWASERSAGVAVVEPPEAAAAARSWLEWPLGREVLARVGALPERARRAAPAAGSAALEVLGQPLFDAVYVLRLYLTGAALPLLSRSPRPVSVLDADDDDAATLRTIAQLHEERGESAAARATLEESSAHGRLAEAILPRFDCVLAAAPGDARSLTLHSGRSDPVRTLANAVDLSSLPHRPFVPQEPSRVLFVGNLGYLPNRDAAERLARTVLPALRRDEPSTRLDLVGAGALANTDGLGEHAERDGVDVHGAVDDLAPLYARASVAVVPLRAGGGSRIKLLEAFAWGVPVVATPQAAAGLDVRHGEELLLASSDEELVLAVQRLRAEPQLARRLSAGARRFVEEHHDLDRVSRQLAAIAGLAEEPSSNGGDC